VNGIEAAAVEANLFIWFQHVVVYSRTYAIERSGSTLARRRSGS
jgi:hypothetical protein